MSNLTKKNDAELAREKMNLKPIVRHKVVYNRCFGGFGVSNKAIDWMAERGHSGAKSVQGTEFASYALERLMTRHDPLLVRCVEELDTEADGRHAKLDVYELQGSAYRVDEYDGMETVVEPNIDEWIIITGDSVIDNPKLDE